MTALTAVCISNIRLHHAPSPCSELLRFHSQPFIYWRCRGRSGKVIPLRMGWISKSGVLLLIATLSCIVPHDDLGFKCYICRYTALSCTLHLNICGTDVVLGIFHGTIGSPSRTLPKSHHDHLTDQIHLSFSFLTPQRIYPA